MATGFAAFLALCSVQRAELSAELSVGRARRCEHQNQTFPGVSSQGSCLIGTVCLVPTAAAVWFEAPERFLAASLLCLPGSGPEMGFCWKPCRVLLAFSGPAKEGGKHFLSLRLPVTGSCPSVPRHQPYTQPPSLTDWTCDLPPILFPAGAQAPSSNPSTFTRRSVVYPELELAL